MIKKTIRVSFAVIAALALLILSGCSPYRSHYRAIAFVHSNTSDRAYMSFLSFDGTMVFRLNCKSVSGARIVYSAGLEDGSAEVFLDNGGEKTGLFSLSSGDELNGSFGELKKGPVYIIVETDGECTDGDLSFEIG